MKQRRNALAVAGLLALGGAALAVPAQATDNANHRTAILMPLNNSGTHGFVSARVMGTSGLAVRQVVQGATPGQPHAVHIHFGAQARHECPTVRDDKDRNFRLNVAEGVPQYGPVAVSLTRKGGTAPSDGLALERMPLADARGVFHYLRTDLKIATTKDQNAAAVATAIRRGQGVVVVHGVDYNNNGRYDLQGAGKSELSPPGTNVPAEATDPAACGVLRN